MHFAMWNTVCAAALMSAFLLTWCPVNAREVTNEDIRDSILSLVHMFRTSEDKLERHEFREKALGETLKKMLVSIEKRQKSLEPLRGAMSRLDERLSNVETILMQQEEREKKVQEKTNDALEAIQKALAQLTSGQTISAVGIDERAGAANTNSIDDIKADILSIKDSLSKDFIKAACQEAGQLSEAEKLLTKYELKLSEYNNSSPKVPTDFVPLNEVAISDEAWHSKMSDVMEKQEQEIVKIRHILSDAEGIWKSLPRATDIQESTNQTLAAIGQARYHIISSDDQGVSKLETKIREFGEKSAETNADIQKSLAEGNTITERMYADVSRSYDQLRAEVKTISNVERVILQTADNVMDTKKRVEYGVHQILLEVGELIKSQGKNLNKTVHDRFDSIQERIVESQTGALTNLSSKLETEMSQVWRQIGIMYQELTASKASLDRLQKQTEQYVNGSAITMDSMENKVGLITSRMSEVDENLNYLLGRLSLVTQEFNQIRHGLGDALDNIKTSFVAVQNKIKDAGPGPHKINSAEAAA